MTKYIGLKEIIGVSLEKIRNQEHPLSSLNNFGNYIVVKYILDNLETFKDVLTEETVKSLKEIYNKKTNGGKK
jgi:hypothetical protein